MNTTPDKQQQFRRSFYIENLEEASFLYEQRLLLLNDTEITWKDLAGFEERFEAHIDALVVGEEPALEVCRAEALEGDFGELHAAVRVFCRQNKGDLVAEAWRDLSLEDVQCTKAIRDALKEECPDNWQESLTSIFLRNYFQLIPIAAPLFGYRRFKAEKALLHALHHSPDHILPYIIWALGRTGRRSAHSALIPFIEHLDINVRKAAAESLLRFGETEAVKQSLSDAPSGNWPLTAIGLGGGPDAAKILQDRVKQGNGNDECLIAMGLLGNLSAVSDLYLSLAKEDLARSAATGLYLITGAELYEEVFIPDDIDEDELFEEELEAYRKEGKVPTTPGGEPFGETVRRLSQNPQDWEAWFRENQSRFNPNCRYRLGKPYTPASLLETLISETSPYRARQLAIEELKIRYGADFNIEADMPVLIQEKILPQIAQWVQTNEGQFQPGAWYFAGRLIAG
ncbi:MAG: HEAT repeat domain-containing protein [Desulfobacteraceae bacterium]|jgi:uncharacterized protein (TIGR02270 family)